MKNDFGFKNNRLIWMDRTKFMIEVYDRSDDPEGKTSFKHSSSLELFKRESKKREEWEKFCNLFVKYGDSRRTVEIALNWKSFMIFIRIYLQDQGYQKYLLSVDYRTESTSEISFMDIQQHIEVEPGSSAYQQVFSCKERLYCFSYTLNRFKYILYTVNDRHKDRISIEYTNVGNTLNNGIDRAYFGAKSKYSHHQIITCNRTGRINMFMMKKDSLGFSIVYNNIKY